jgi:hypothetical protein
MVHGKTRYLTENQEYLRRDVLATFEAAKLVIRTIGFLSNRNSLLDKSATSKSRTPGRFEWMIEGTAVNNNWVGSCRRAWSVSMFRIQPCYTKISKVVKRLIVWISTPVLVGRSSWENGSGESLDKAFGSTSSRINRAIRLNSDHGFIRQQQSVQYTLLVATSVLTRTLLLFCRAVGTGHESIERLETNDLHNERGKPPDKHSG